MLFNSCIAFVTASVEWFLTLSHKASVRLKKYIVGTTAIIGSYADYNGDGYINSSDLVSLKKHLLGIALIGGEFVSSKVISGGAYEATAMKKQTVISN